MMSIASRFWRDNPFTVQPRQHEEINVIVKPEENIKHDDDCGDDSAIEAFDECVRLQTEANMYNFSFAERFCDASEAFGNCTIPQVIQLKFDYRVGLVYTESTQKLRSRTSKRC